MDLASSKGRGVIISNSTKGETSLVSGNNEVLLGRRGKRGRRDGM